MSRLRRILWVILFFGGFLGIGTSTRAQEEPQIEPTLVDYTMGGQIRFETRLVSENPVKEAWVFVHPLGNPGTIAGAATLHPSNVITYVLELADHPIPAYSTVEYWYQITLEGGTSFTTSPETFIYADNRFEWQTLEDSPFEVAWYEGDIAFGQEVLNAAQASISSLQTYVPAPAPAETAIFVYASATELQTALRLSGQTGAWVAGHASPELGTVVVSVAPGPAQTYEIKRQIPHEIAHVMLYQWLGEDYNNLPQWLREGLPSMAELFPNPDYPLLLTNAYENQGLLPMASLCESFPLEASNFLLAYAQSTDFTWFLYEHYGSSGLEALVNAYADGLGCEEGPQAALGQSLSELEQQWRQQTFGENTFMARLQGLLPWIVLLGVILLAPVLLIFGKKGGSETR